MIQSCPDHHPNSREPRNGMTRSIRKVTSKLVVCIIAIVVFVDVAWKGAHDHYYRRWNFFDASIIQSSLSTVVIKQQPQHQQDETRHINEKVFTVVDNEGASTTTPVGSGRESSPEEPTTTTNFPLPLQILHEYQQRHSDTVLWREYNSTIFTTTTDSSSDHDANINSSNHSTTTRRFAIAYYSCPSRAGNFLHYFFNAIVWSMIHDRTVLWKFFRLHERSSTIEDCERILKRTGWIPSYDEWTERLNLSSPVNVPLLKISDDSPLQMQHRQKEDQYQHHQVVLFPQFPDGIFSATVQKNMTRHGWADHPMKRDDSMEYVQSLPQSMQDTALALYTYGPGFLYGMLYSELFELQSPTSEHFLHKAADDDTVYTLSIDNPVSSHESSTNETFNTHENRRVKERPRHLKIAIHSRHTVAEDDGSFIRDEIKCLTKILPTRSQQVSQHIPCSLYLMSDREQTISNIRHWIIERHNDGMGPDCNIITANHSTSMSLMASKREEHGPWSGVGFFQDLDVVANALDVLIGDINRSSTRLLLEIMEYRRGLSILLQQNREHADDKSLDLPRLIQCKLPERSASSGYDYGPGTPTFKLPSS